MMSLDIAQQSAAHGLRYAPPVRPHHVGLFKQTGCIKLLNVGFS